MRKKAPRKRIAEDELAIETAFPLALGRAELRPDPVDTARMIEQIMAWRGGEFSGSEEYVAWSGDLRGVWYVHRHPTFRWLTAAVERHTRAYCARLGFDLSAVAFQFQRSWPVVSESGQGVGRHHHPNAHLSCVYYLNGDGSGESGVLRLFAPHHPNELVPGMAVGYYPPIDPESPLNRLWVDVAPISGLLVFFPAHTDHAVTENATMEVRLSVSFDIHLSSPHPAGETPAEYLAPHPRTWDDFGATGRRKG